MQLRSLKVLGRSVAISMARIWTALFSSPFALTKFSLHTIAQALPSLVGLRWCEIERVGSGGGVERWREWRDVGSEGRGGESGEWGRGGEMERVEGRGE